MLRLEDKVALVTGGGSIGEGLGNGRAMCLRFAQEGGTVAVMDRTAAAAQETVDAIVRDGGRAMAVVGDVTVRDDCQRAVDATVKEFGRLDILVNNVGIPGEATSVVDVTEEDWDHVLDVNLKSVMWMSKFAVPQLRVRGGAIVNISSIASFRQSDRIAYPASKGAINSMTMAMAGWHAREGIRVNCVAPGQVYTPAVGHTWAPDDQAALAEVRERRRKSSLMKTEGTAWDIANAVLFFASDESRWVTGQTILVDGGLHIGRPPAVE